jgi:hypothetical protein
LACSSSVHLTDFVRSSASFRSWSGSSATSSRAFLSHSSYFARFSGIAGHSRSGASTASEQWFAPAREHEVFQRAVRLRGQVVQLLQG